MGTPHLAHPLRPVPCHHQRHPDPKGEAMNGTGINLPGLALVVIAVVLVIALIWGWNLNA